MPANLPAEAKAKWLKVLEARTPEEKLRALQEFLSAVPKHKGTEKLISQIRHKIAVLRREIEERRRRRGGRRSEYTVPKEGDLQIVMLGMPNCGKSALLRRLTNAKVESSPVPFTTQKPVPGTLNHEGVLIQLVEAPSITEGASEGYGLGRHALSLARNADGLMLVLDAREGPLKQLYTLIKELEGAHISIVPPRGYVEIKRARGTGIRVVGNLRGCTVKDVERLLHSYGIYNAIVKIHGEATLDDIESAIFESRVYKPTIIVVNKVEDEETRRRAERVREVVRGKLPVIFASAERGEVPASEIGEAILRALKVIRVYTKEPGSEPSPKPLVLPEGSRVIDVARRIHTYLYEHFKYAKVWSKHLPYSPQKVGPDFVLHDGDIVEIHA